VATLNLQVGASTDDAWQDAGATSSDLTAPDPNVGTGTAASSPDRAASWRFTAVGISQGESITSATFQLRKSGAAWSQVTHTLRGENVDNSATFTTALITNRATTTANTAVSDNTNRADNAWISYTVTSIVQEIINRGGWVSGNALSIISIGDGAVDHASNAYHFWDGVAASAAKLDITYGPPPPVAEAAPTFVAAGAAAFTATNAATLAPGLPAGWAADDIHVLVVHRSDNTDITDPSGWTKISPSGVADTNTTAQIVELYLRRAVAGDTDPTITAGTGTIVRGAQIFGVRGGNPHWPVDNARVLDVSSRLNNAAGATIPTTNVTSLVTNTLGLYIGAYEDDPTTGSTPTGWGAVTVAGSALGTDMMICRSTRTFAASGTSYDTPTTTVSGGTFANSVNVGILLGFRPVPRKAPPFARRLPLHIWKRRQVT